jgi:hypothetical protein
VRGTAYWDVDLAGRQVFTDVPAAGKSVRRQENGLPYAGPARSTRRRQVSANATSRPQLASAVCTLRSSTFHRIESQRYSNALCPYLNQR